MRERRWGGKKRRDEIDIPLQRLETDNKQIVHYLYLDLPAFAAENTRRSQQQKRRRHEQQHAKPGKNPHPLSPMPDDRSPRMTQFILTRSSIVMPEQKVVVERLQAIPAKDVFASLAHHLSAAFLSLDEDVTNRTAFNRRRIQTPVGARRFHRRRTAP